MISPFTGIAHRAIAPVDRQIGGAAVAAEREEAGVDQHAPVLAIMADHAGRTPMAMSSVAHVPSSAWTRSPNA